MQIKRYGKPKRAVEEDTELFQSRQASKWVLVLGSVMVAIFLGGTAAKSTLFVPDEGMEGEVIAVMSTGIQEREPIQTGSDTAVDAIGEGFGILDGEWNLWEYLGDLFSTLFMS